jgi:hypothetical protein
MVNAEIQADIRRMFYVDKMKVYAISQSAYFGEAGHLFRRKPVTCFGASRSAMLTPSERSDV